MRANLSGGDLERLPFDPGEDVCDELGLEVDLFLDEHRVLEVQGEGEGGGLAGLDGAADVVCCEDLHFGFWLCFFLCV